MQGAASLPSRGGGRPLGTGGVLVGAVWSLPRGSPGRAAMGWSCLWPQRATAQEWVQWACVIRGVYLGVPGSGSFSPEFLSVQSGANLCAGRPAADLQRLGKRPLRLGAGDTVAGLGVGGNWAGIPTPGQPPWDLSPQLLRKPPPFPGTPEALAAGCPFRGGTPSAPPHSTSSLCIWVTTTGGLSPVPHLRVCSGPCV